MKMYFLLHYLLFSGTFVRALEFWCMRYEAKHFILNSYHSELKIIFPWTLACRHHNIELPSKANGCKYLHP